MGRGITDKVIFKGILTLDTSLHLGSGLASAETDALLLRDTDEKLFISGTSIGGALRSRMEQLIGAAVGHQENIEDCACLICRLFGTAERGASKIVVEDAYPTADRDFATPEIRDGVAICRNTQTAREGAKYDLETIPAGYTFDFELSVDLNNDVDEEEMKMILYIGLKELCCGRVYIGGDTTRGLGRCHLNIENPDKIYTLDFRNTDCLVPFLKKDDLTGISEKYITTYEDYFADIKESLTFNNELELHTRLELDFDLILEDMEDMLVIGDGRYAFGDDPETRFVRTTLWSDAQKDWVDIQFIPGGSLKGPLRNRAEQILRTLVPESACDPTESGGCGQCRICKLFGYSKKAEGEEGRRGRLTVEDAYPLITEIQEKKFDFVAIDRFTGGAMEKAKFDARIATKGCFKSRLIMDNPELYELALIAHLFKDLYLKDIRLGYGKYKGFGRVKGILREVRLLQTMKDSGLIDSLNLAKTFPENKGYWQRSGIWHVLTIKKEEFCNDNCYKPLHEVRNLRAIIETLDQAFREFVDKDLIPIKEREEELR